MTYEDSQYDKYLRRRLIPDQEFIDQLNSINPETLVPPQSVDSSRVKSLTLDKLSGGELSVGGVGNELGSIIIRNDRGEEIASIDNRGITTL